MPSPQSNAWVFTLNNPEAALELPPDGRYLVYQREAGEQGTEHFQGYVELTKRKTMHAMKTWLPRAHFERRRGTQAEARAYCMKEDSRVDGPWELGTFVENSAGKRTDLEDVRDAIMDGATRRSIYLEYPAVAARCPRYIDSLFEIRREDSYEPIGEFTAKFPWQQRVLDYVGGPVNERDIYWVHDPFGNSGKTFLARYLVDSFDAFYSNGGKGTDICYAYDGQPVVIFDYVRDSKDYVNYGVIEQLKNGILTSGKYESKTKRFKQPHVLVFANFPPEDGKFSRDRLTVLELNSTHQIV